MDYLDRTDNLNMKLNYSNNTLTSLACGVCTYIINGNDGYTHENRYIFFFLVVPVHNVTSDIIETFCERGVSMVIFDFHDLTYEQSRKMVYEIRQGVFNYSLNKNDQIPYSLALVLDLVGSRIITGTIYTTKVKPFTNNRLIIRFRDIFTGFS